jgi:hypothetical protein
MAGFLLFLCRAVVVVVVLRNANPHTPCLFSCRAAGMGNLINYGGAVS